MRGGLTHIGGAQREPRHGTQGLHRRRGRHHGSADPRAAGAPRRYRADRRRSRAAQGSRRPAGGLSPPPRWRSCACRMRRCAKSCRGSTGAAVRLIDASTAHRTDPGWAFGFPEMAPGQRAEIAAAARVSNPGCWSTCAIALIRPLVAAGLIDPAPPPAISGISGYTGGGKPMIAEFESGTVSGSFLYGAAQAHKHLPEIAPARVAGPRAGVRALGRRLCPGHGGGGGTATRRRQPGPRRGGAARRPMPASASSPW